MTTSNTQNTHNTQKGGARSSSADSAYSAGDGSSEADPAGLEGVVAPDPPEAESWSHEERYAFHETVGRALGDGLALEEAERLA